MAMQAPPPEAAEDDDEGGAIFAEVTITPLTDVILVLLIIVMVSSTAMVEAARQGRIDVELPSAGAGATTDVNDDKVLLIGILRDGRVSLGDEVVDEATLEQRLKDRYAKDPPAFIVLDADGDLAHKVVVSVLDMARRIGFTNVGIGVTEGSK